MKNLIVRVLEKYGESFGLNQEMILYIKVKILYNGKNQTDISYFNHSINVFENFNKDDDSSFKMTELDLLNKKSKGAIMIHGEIFEIFEGNIDDGLKRLRIN